MLSMRKELLVHLAYSFSFLVFVSLTHNYLHLEYWPFWIGGIFGTFLPDIDHVIYVLFMRPQELTSQRVGFYLNKKDFKKALFVLYDTRNERRGLIFHTVFFQAIFLVLCFLILSSSGSPFGKGMVLAFALHLVVDQIVDLTELGSFENWLNLFPFKMTFQNARTYWIVTSSITVVMGLFM